MINLAITDIRCGCGSITFRKVLGSNDWIKCDMCGQEHLNQEVSMPEIKVFVDKEQVDTMLKEFVVTHPLLAGVSLDSIDVQGIAHDNYGNKVDMIEVSIYIKG
jgi:hypothetical protein